MAENKLRLLSEAGKKEFGYIFPDGYVPVIDITPIDVNVAKEGTVLVFLIDYERLTAHQQENCIAYLAEQFNVSEAAVQEEIESNGHFPMRKCYIIESYDLRYFI